MSDENRKIEIILTGGTIDSTWDGISDTATVNSHSVIPNYFKKLIVYPEVKFNEICMKDSRQINEQDISKVLESIEKSEANKIIITHGTYTMPDTAKFIEANLTRKDQTIIFTGSMVPLEGFYPTDAPFNLGFAVSKSQELSPGIYLCMNGETFTPQEVAKNLGEGKFYSIFQKNIN
ncbi:MAG TPA: asparaginase domain-containing protein [Candidatus Paceibacterota bacterium]|jgi:L-asparaginase|nr:asparaginase domain-containing protein [Candidatus Paceibacterota bacterium]